MNALKLLSRNEMKMIKGGIDECSTTNCQICEVGPDRCVEFNGELPDPNCYWGLCGFCCDD